MDPSGAREIRKGCGAQKTERAAWHHFRKAADENDGFARIIERCPRHRASITLHHDTMRLSPKRDDVSG
jgi:hypothetical protein